MDIAALLLWICTAAAGVSVLGARRPARASGEPAPAEAQAPAAVRSPAGVPAAASAAVAAGAKVPPISHTRITTQPGQHPMLEFLHPALGIIGLGCWTAFVISRFHAFAWAAVAVIVVTIAAGVTWYTVNSRAARAARPGGPGSAAGRYPARRLMVHGSAAAVTLVLAIVTVLAAGHI